MWRREITPRAYLIDAEAAGSGLKLAGLKLAAFKLAAVELAAALGSRADELAALGELDEPEPAESEASTLAKRSRNSVSP